jgi:hypothetical protein
MMHKTLFFLLLLASYAVAEQAQYGKPGVRQSGSQARSQTTCPWLTQGSASTMLGGDVSVKVSVSETGKSSCRFSRQQGSHDSLEILVSKAALVTWPCREHGVEGYLQPGREVQGPRLTQRRR